MQGLSSPLSEQERAPGTLALDGRMTCWAESCVLGGAGSEGCRSHSPLRMDRGADSPALRAALPKQTSERCRRKAS